jgi:hypothetical protein
MDEECERVTLKITGTTIGFPVDKEILWDAMDEGKRLRFTNSEDPTVLDLPAQTDPAVLKAAIEYCISRYDLTVANPKHASYEIINDNISKLDSREAQEKTCALLRLSEALGFTAVSRVIADALIKRVNDTSVSPQKLAEAFFLPLDDMENKEWAWFTEKQ